MKGLILIAVIFLAEGPPPMTGVEGGAGARVKSMTGVEGVDGEKREPVAVDPDRVRLELAIDPSAVLIDVRMRFEYRREHIEKAVHLPKKKDLDQFAASTPKMRPIYLYCTTETRARQARQLLLDYGFERVYVLEGGINKWKAYNLPVERRRKRGGRRTT